MISDKTNILQVCLIGDETDVCIYVRIYVLKQ